VNIELRCDNGQKPTRVRKVDDDGNVAIHLRHALYSDDGTPGFTLAAAARSPRGQAR
jgi:hypothetical protein